MYHIVIPARYGSTRLPAKALADINGKPLVYWVWRRALASSALSVTVGYRRFANLRRPSTAWCAGPNDGPSAPVRHRSPCRGRSS